MKLIVLDLPRDFSQDALENLFKTYGSVTTCNLIMDEKTGTSKGLGFVEMAQGQDAEMAIRELHGSKIDKSKIRVKPAN
ncbi:MAG: RNA-binding protein [Sneathiella sp.]|nr:RNA-binding protein [Sneathiella sp.]